jgi:glycosyltransferase involved in cell wall biosynthesis
VAIVIPTFNRSEFVTRTVDSALGQTYSCEVIVCDHGSHDSTPEVMKQYENKIKYIRREKDFGPHFCWLDGVLNTNAAFIHLQFDDDYIEPDFIEKALVFMKDPDVGVVFSNAKIFNYTSREYSKVGSKKRLPTGIHKNRILKKILFAAPSALISPAACLFRRNEVIDALYQGNLPIDFGGNYHGVGPDVLMTLLCLLRFKKFGFIKEELAVFGSHDGSITIDSQKDIQKAQRLEKGYRSLKTYYNLISLYQKNWVVRCLAAYRLPFINKTVSIIKYLFKILRMQRWIKRRVKA